MTTNLTTKIEKELRTLEELPGSTASGDRVFAAARAAGFRLSADEYSTLADELYDFECEDSPHTAEVAAFLAERLS